MTSRPLVVGVGNPYRRDDGVGWRVAELIDRPGVDVVCTDGEPARLVELWSNRDPVVVVDAVMAGGPAGAVEVLARGDVPAAQLATSHGGGVAPAIELAEALGRLPSHLWVVTISGRDFDVGAGCTRPVADAVDRAVAAVHRVLDTEAARFTTP